MPRWSRPVPRSANSVGPSRISSPSSSTSQEEAMFGNLRAELATHVRRPAIWLVLAVAVILTITFGYLVPYTSINGTTTGGPGAGRTLADLLPGAFPGVAIAGTPIFAGAEALIVGV